MDQVPLDEQFCDEVCLTKFMLDVESRDIDLLGFDPSALTDGSIDGSVILADKKIIISRAAMFVKFTMDDCEVCVLDIPKSEKKCPQSALLQVIRETI